jgi:hypothetical protein
MYPSQKLKRTKWRKESSWTGSINDNMMSNESKTSGVLFIYLLPLVAAATSKWVTAQGLRG